MSELHDKFAELGKICAEAEALDLCVCFGISGCLPGVHGPEDKRMSLHKYAAGAFVAAERTLSERIELLHTLGTFIIERSHPEHAARFDKLIRRTHNAREVRNKRVHALMTEDGAIRKQFGLRRIEKGGPLGDVEEVSLSQLKQDVEQIRSITRDLSLFLAERGLWLLPYIGRDE